jgi:hypothetical protein
MFLEFLLCNRSLHVLPALRGEEPDCIAERVAVFSDNAGAYCKASCGGNCEAINVTASVRLYAYDSQRRYIWVCSI